LYFSAARSLPSTHITILTLLEPLTATVMAAAVFGEALTVGAIVGPLMLGAVVGPRAREDPKAPPPAPAKNEPVVASHGTGRIDEQDNHLTWRRGDRRRHRQPPLRRTPRPRPTRNFVVFNVSTGALNLRGIAVTTERVRADALGVPRKGAR
jgi:hypothetical protein